MVIYHACIGTSPNISQHTKFEVPSFTLYQDMIETPEFKKWVTRL